MLRIFLIAITVFFFSCGRGKHEKYIAGATTQNADLTAKLDKYVEALTAMGQFNGVLYISDSNSVLLHKGYTTEDYTSPYLSVDKNSQFDLRSVSKLFAKTVLLEMEAEGTIDISMPLSQYLEGFPFGDAVTIEQLMDHRSGLPRELTATPDDALSLSPEEVIALIKEESLEFEPGTDERYSNPGYQVLYYLIGKIAGRPYPQVLRERYFDPLGMSGTGSHFLDPASSLSNYAYGHYVKNDSLQVVETLEREDMQMGHLFSTAKDMARFMTYLSQSPAAKKLNQEGTIAHAGGSRGKRAWVYTDKQKRYTIVFLANIDMLPFERLTKDLVSMVNGEAVAIPQPVNRVGTMVSPAILRSYSGTYDFVDAGHLVLAFKLENDTLVAWQKGERAGTLIPENDSVFFWDPKSTESILFIKDEQGEPKAYMDFQGVRWEGQRIKDERGKSQNE